MLKLESIQEAVTSYQVIFAGKKNIGTIYMEEDGLFVYAPNSDQGHFTSYVLDIISTELKKLNKLSLDEIFRLYHPLK
jgi:6-phosphogluconolactonase (cycloisomerase 2 family)